MRGAVRSQNCAKLSTVTTLYVLLRVWSLLAIRARWVHMLHMNISSSFGR